jgi:uncharacterized protein YyaL (SSP411 family)
MRNRRSGLLAALAALLAAAAAVPAPPGEGQGKPNRLAQENSPYLRQHAHNPVDWFPWGPEAFAKAAREKKLIFLSIGYSSCHWCHVMERESFSDPEVAKLLNDWFVCVKVDREERPDVDEIYMTALHLMRNRGGWPLSMFLTAEGKPILGGTYWPKEDRQIDGETVRGFKSVLKAVHDLQTEEPKELQERADGLAAAVNDYLKRAERGRAVGAPDRQVVTAAVDEAKEEFDPEYGGFGQPARQFRGSKFPMPSYLALLQEEAARSKDAELTKVVATTLDRMARGGIYDQVGGGFHRYSTERTWTVPHFEKMLYDNAQLVERYAAAYRAAPNPLYRRVVRETLGFVRRELTDPRGGFYSALDADSAGEEGRFYVWTAAEIETALPDRADAELVRTAYGVAAGPNFEGKYSILTLPRPLSEVARGLGLSEEQLDQRLAETRRKLLDARSKRPRPFLDTKVLTAWNGQMIAGYAAAGQALAEPAYVAAAARAAEFVLANLRTPDGRLRRTFDARPDAPAQARLNAYLDDYAFLIHGLLNLHEATGDARWLAEAKALADTMVHWHGDAERGGFYSTSHDHEKLFARAKDQFDGAQPSGNSVALRDLVRLAKLTRDNRYHDLAEKGFRAFAGPLRSNPSSLTAMVAALALDLEQPPAGGGRPEP